MFTYYHDLDDDGDDPLDPTWTPSPSETTYESSDGTTRSSTTTPAFRDAQMLPASSLPPVVPSVGAEIQNTEMFRLSDHEIAELHESLVSSLLSQEQAIPTVPKPNTTASPVEPYLPSSGPYIKAAALPTGSERYQQPIMLPQQQRQVQARYQQPMLPQQQTAEEEKRILAMMAQEAERLRLQQQMATMPPSPYSTATEALHKNHPPLVGHPRFFPSPSRAIEARAVGSMASASSPLSAAPRHHHLPKQKRPEKTSATLTQVPKIAAGAKPLKGKKSGAESGHSPRKKFKFYAHEFKKGSKNKVDVYVRTRSDITTDKPKANASTNENGNNHNQTCVSPLTNRRP